MKILYVATVRSHIGQFHMPFIKHLCQNGHIVDAAFKDNSNDKKGLDLSALNRTFEVPFERNPFKFNNIKAYFILKKIINEGNYDIIHCHTPMGAAITRLAAKNVRKKGTKIFYTAHGFHFYEGASKKNWLLFYPIEKWLSRYTDCLILINNEDYKLAINKNFKAKKIKKINGVGVELSKFNHNLCNKKNQLREQYGYNQDMFSLIYPADLSIRKNQIMLLDTINLLKNKIPNIKLLLPGQPILKQEYEEYCIKNGIQDYVDFLGYRRDIPKLVALSDIAVSSSKQEGLPINIVEAMAMGKPVVCTNVRGNSDLIDDKGGYLIELNDSKDMANKIIKLYNDEKLRKSMGNYNKCNIVKFSVSAVIKELQIIYEEFNVRFKEV